ncbi:MAG: nuclear transport factor 2 family protein [Sciscionella sp.]
MSAPTIPGITWRASQTEHPARLAAWRSMAAVVRGARDEWVALFVEDGVVEDPVGPSMFDPDGRGHHGRLAIAAFWDASIAMVERFQFTITDSFAAGSECANVGTITTFLPGGMRVDTEGVFVYRAAADGQIASMRAFWETERAAATLRGVDD